MRGKGIWKFNNSLLQYEDYVKVINSAINDEKLKYALPVYNLDFIKSNFNSFEMTIDQDTFLEMLLLRIRGESIKFASGQKKKESKTERQLIKDIETLESQESNFASNSTLLPDKRADLERIRSKKLEGQMVRSRIQWLQEGEKPSKYFCNLESRNYVEKTIKKVTLNNGTVITDQTEILTEIQQYYSKLFANKDDILKNVNFESLGLTSNHKFSEDLGIPLMVKEVEPILKK